MSPIWSRFSLLLTVAALAGPAKAALYDNAYDAGNGLKLTWHGKLDDSRFPWIYHTEHGWLYCLGYAADGVWFKDPDLGRIWTAAYAYPWIYDVEDGWLRYERGTTGSREYYSQARDRTETSDSPNLQNRSFMPIPEGRDSTWIRYEVNNRRKITSNVDGVEIEIEPGWFTVRHYGDTGVQEGSFSGDITGWTQGTEITGSYDIEINSHIIVENGTPILESESAEIDIVLFAGGGRVRVDMFVEATPSLPFEWFLSRDDLGELPVGYTSSWSAPLDTRGSVRFEAPGYPGQTESLDDSIYTTDTWTIVDARDAYSVNGRAFQNVVVINRSTLATNPQTGQFEQTIITLFVAEGIGVIKAVNYLPVYDQFATIELFDASFL